MTTKGSISNVLQLFSALKTANGTEVFSVRGSLNKTLLIITEDGKALVTLPTHINISVGSGNTPTISIELIVTGYAESSEEIAKVLVPEPEPFNPRKVKRRIRKM